MVVKSWYVVSGFELNSRAGFEEPWGIRVYLRTNIEWLGSSCFLFRTQPICLSLCVEQHYTPRFHVLRKGHRKWHEDNALCYPPHAMFLLTDAHFSLFLSLLLQLCKSTQSVPLLPKLHNLPRSQGEVLREPSLEDSSGISVCLLGEWCMKPAKTLF